MAVYSVDIKEYQVMYGVEDHHWWYVGMEAITRKCLERYYPRGSHLRILDAGCGTGAVMGYLADYGTVTGIDYSAEALRFCQIRRRERLVQASVVSLPYRDAMFDLVASFDVIDELGVSDDTMALREFVRVLTPGGRVILRLPGTPWLHGQHDIAVDVQRRYTARQVEGKLCVAGFQPEHVTYANTLLFPLAVVKRFSERFFPPQNGSDLTLGMGPFDGFLRVVLSSEAPRVARSGFPFGLTVVALARKP
jgi:ubiquinone/menaquinone biosynthesis C-methylase UbiE